MSEVLTSEIAESLTMAQAEILKRFDRPEVHAVEVPRGDDRSILERLKLIDWVPPMFGSSSLYTITDMGRRVRKEL